MIRHLLTGEEIGKVEFEKLIDLSREMKATRGTAKAVKPLADKSIGMIFAKSSTRTRVSFEVGIHELGGQAIYLDQSKTQMGRGETVPDTARVLSRYLGGIVIRTYKQSDIEELAQYSSCPIINALTDDYHPCQALTDMFTIYEKVGKFEGIKMAYLGDGASNMANSLMMASRIAGIHFEIGAPEEYKPSDAILNNTFGGSGTVSWTKDPAEAVKDADFIYTDVWVSMGFEEEAKERMRILDPYRLDMATLLKAKPGAMVMHCLPAHRGEEITDDVMESPNSIVFDEAENRLHVQKAIMATLIK
ncbi:MAG: ornithine carbamoyltransferase [Lentisphaeria bacterium]|nr:ornithine carbamoyltransferase [Lentisphaerota bacterium]MBO5694580.1 ornithine carbamoyltransferase [Lentisphaeria bacterium]MBR3708213.1 ornithine carbamoyltransferase [Lentisphaeria bacterium]